MRAKQSITATGMYSSTGSLTIPLPIHASTPSAQSGDGSNAPNRASRRDFLPGPLQIESAGLLHDARNLIGTLGLYCDLLSLPGVLKPEHREYAQDLRLVSVRSGALIERLVDRLANSGPASLNPPNPAPLQTEAPRLSEVRTTRSVTAKALKPVSLRSIVERCSGLLSRVAGGREIEITYGEAAAVAIAVQEEAVERILVNLVRNSAAALAQRAATVGMAQAQGDSSAGPAPAVIRIGVGLLVNRVGDAKPWPFRRVRLTVEDSGCGMPQEQLETLVSAGTPLPHAIHGFGFRIIRELVAASEGDLRIMSAPGLGTVVQIEWPISAGASAQAAEGREPSVEALHRRQAAGASGDAGRMSC